MGTIFDWNNISKEYIQGIKIRDIQTGVVSIRFPSLPELSKKHDIKIETIRNRSAHEKWGFQKKAYQRKLKIKNNEVTPEDLLGESSKFDSLHLSIAEGITRLVLERMEPHLKLLEQSRNEDGSMDYFELDTRYQARNSEANIEDEISSYKPISIKELRDISAILKDNHQTVRSILGENTTTQNLLDDVQEQWSASRKNKLTLNQTNRYRIKQELRRIEEIQTFEAELQVRRQELVKLLDAADDKNSDISDENSEL